ncbi:hypothetical protein [Cupriavidus sp. AU9028]|uniref:hypothetical protein n=1 Tax=Cupriavidus sp. AU9028 TaxID=2871157 RepID=UPI002106FD24|nr:hypothetical protein [Cupriavidus sp. AU9028]
MTLASPEYAALWVAVLASGLYHGVNPAMGWPIAVSNAMLARAPAALLAALGYLLLGHVLAVLAVLLPFGMLASLQAWQTQIRLVASVLVIGYGLALLRFRRHPRALVRIAPSRLALWSFAIALAHGAGLMLVPIYLGLCGSDADAGHRAMDAIALRNLRLALLVALAHAAAMFAMAASMAWLTYRYLGLRLVARSWFRIDVIWAGSLLAVGTASLVTLDRG